MSRVTHSSVSNFRPLKSYTTVIFDTWYDEFRVKDVVGGSSTCSHLSVEGERCVSCGAFVGHVGAEHNCDDFYRHVHMLSNFVYPDNDFFVLSDRCVPNDYVLDVLGRRVITKHNRSTWYIERQDKFVNVFSLSIVSRRNLNLWKGFWFDFILAKAGSPLLILNPKKEYLSFQCDYVVANKVFNNENWIV